MDEVLACFVGSDRELEIFPDFINNIYSSIKYIMEKEEINRTNILDVINNRVESYLEFSIYRKQIHTNLTIRHDSFHLTSRKLAAYNLVIHTEFTIPLPINNFTKKIKLQSK